MKFKIKNPASALTHFIAMLFTIFATTPLLLKASISSDTTHTFALAIFITSMILLYAASTIYHTLDISPKVNDMLKKIDHMMIFILIAGTYTHICLIVLGDGIGWFLLIFVWAIALIGIGINAIWIHCPKWVSSITYIGMGWLCIFAMGKIIASLPDHAFEWLLAGGVIYTVGGIIYALKLSVINNKFKHFGSHEIFHLFVMGGSFCHYFLMYHFVA